MVTHEVAKIRDRKMLTGIVKEHAETLPLPGGVATIFPEDILARKIKQQFHISQFTGSK